MGLCGTAFAATAESEFSWSNVCMGGGGFVSAVVASPAAENLFYARTDVGGAYRWEETSKSWVSMMDWVDVTERGLLGIEAIVADPKDGDKVYMMAGTSYWNNGRSAFLRSGNRGKSWEVLYTWDSTGEKGGVVTRFGMHGNGMGRGNGEALAVDPNNTDIMFYGSKNKGLWKSTDNGSSWSHVDAWTTAAGSDTTWNGSGFSFVTFAPGSSKVLYAGFLREGTTKNKTFENVFTSTDGGASWKAIPIPVPPEPGEYSASQVCQTMSKPTGTKEAATTAIGFIAATLYCTSLIRDKRTIAGRNICKKLGFERVAKNTSNESTASLNTPMRMAESFPMPSIIAAYHMKQGNAKNFTMTLVGL